MSGVAVAGVQKLASMRRQHFFNRVTHSQTLLKTSVCTNIPPHTHTHLQHSISLQCSQCITDAARHALQCWCVSTCGCSHTGGVCLHGRWQRVPFMKAACDVEQGIEAGNEAGNEAEYK
jgi:hypothetical protein